MQAKPISIVVTSCSAPHPRKSYTFQTNLMQKLLTFIALGAFVLFLPTQAQAQAPSLKKIKKPGQTKPGKPLKRPIKRLIQNLKGKKPKKKKRNPNRYEFGVLPAISGSVDTGFGFGLIANVAKFKEGYYPYQWRLTFLWYMTTKDGGFPFHDDYIALDLPGLAGNTVRLNARVGFRRFTTSGYYGMGNAATGDRSVWEKLDPEKEKDKYLSARQRYQYDRTYPHATLDARILLRPKLFLFVGGAFLYNIMGVYKGSKLEEDIKATQNDSSSGTPLKNLLYGTTNHALVAFNLGTIWDSRNHEFTPSSGGLHEISVRASPGAALGTQYYFVGVNATTRFFFSLYKELLVLGVRVIGDALFGDVPFHVLTTYGGLFGGFLSGDSFGGGTSIRGIRTQRYHGKLKVMGNFELRCKLIPFSIGSNRFNVGLLLFADAGRVWADYGSTEFKDKDGNTTSLDGNGAGIHWGAGAGLRLQWGESFIIRADVAYSPDADPIGFYISINHIF